MRTVGLDLDGVLYRWHESLYEYCRIYRGFDGSYDSFWVDYKNILSTEEIEYLIQIDTLYSNMPPTRDCLALLDGLKDRFEIFYVTSRPETVRTTTESFLKRHKFPFRENLIFTNDKYNVARLYKFEFAVDDLPVNVEDYSKVTRAFMVAQPWNRGYQEKFTTVRRLTEILDLIGDN